MKHSWSPEDKHCDLSPRRINFLFLLILWIILPSMWWICTEFGAGIHQLFGYQPTCNIHAGGQYYLALLTFTFAAAAPSTAPTSSLCAIFLVLAAFADFWNMLKPTIWQAYQTFFHTFFFRSSHNSFCIQLSATPWMPTRLECESARKWRQAFHRTFELL